MIFRLGNGVERLWNRDLLCKEVLQYADCGGVAHVILSINYISSIDTSGETNSSNYIYIHSYT